MAVVIGVDPHKGSHTAVAVDQGEKVAGRAQGAFVSRARSTGSVRGRPSGPSVPGPSKAPAGWATCWPSNWCRRAKLSLTYNPNWAPGCGCWPPATSTRTTPTTPARWPSPPFGPKGLRPVAAEDHAAVLKLWSKRRRDLGSLRTQVVCRLHSVLCDLVPGGHPKKEISARQAARRLSGLEPIGAVGLARYDLAMDFLADLRRIDTQMREAKKRLEVAVKASGTTVTEVFGVGPYVAATVVGYVVDVSRFADRDRFAAYNGTAPIEVSSAATRSSGSLGGATASSTTPSTWWRSPRSLTATARAGPTTTAS